MVEGAKKPENSGVQTDLESTVVNAAVAVVDAAANAGIANRPSQRTVVLTEEEIKFLKSFASTDRVLNVPNDSNTEEKKAAENAARDLIHNFGADKAREVVNKLKSFSEEQKGAGDFSETWNNGIVAIRLDDEVKKIEIAQSSNTVVDTQLSVDDVEFPPPPPMDAGEEVPPAVVLNPPVMPTEPKDPAISKLGYQMVEGDTLESVAESMYTTPDELRKLNPNITDFKGQYIVVPNTAVKGAPAATQKPASEPEYKGFVGEGGVYKVAPDDGDKVRGLIDAYRARDKVEVGSYSYGVQYETAAKAVREAAKINRETLAKYEGVLKENGIKDEKLFSYLKDGNEETLKEVGRNTYKSVDDLINEVPAKNAELRSRGAAASEAKKEPDIEFKDPLDPTIDWGNQMAAVNPIWGSSVILDSIPSEPNLSLATGIDTSSFDNLSLQLQDPKLASDDILNPDNFKLGMTPEEQRSADMMAAAFAGTSAVPAAEQAPSEVKKDEKVERLVDLYKEKSVSVEKRDVLAKQRDELPAISAAITKLKKAQDDLSPDSESGLDSKTAQANYDAAKANLEKLQGEHVSAKAISIYNQTIKEQVAEINRYVTKLDADGQPLNEEGKSTIAGVPTMAEYLAEKKVEIEAEIDDPNLMGYLERQKNNDYVRDAVGEHGKLVAPETTVTKSVATSQPEQKPVADSRPASRVPVRGNGGVQETKLDGTPIIPLPPIMDDKLKSLVNLYKAQDENNLALAKAKSDLDSEPQDTAKLDAVQYAEKKVGEKAAEITRFVGDNLEHFKARAQDIAREVNDKPLQAYLADPAANEAEKSGIGSSGFVRPKFRDLHEALVYGTDEEASLVVEKVKADGNLELINDRLIEGKTVAEYAESKGFAQTTESLKSTGSPAEAPPKDLLPPVEGLGDDKTVSKGSSPTRGMSGKATAAETPKELTAEQIATITDKKVNDRDVLQTLKDQHGLKGDLEEGKEYDIPSKESKELKSAIDSRDEEKIKAAAQAALTSAKPVDVDAAKLRDAARDLEDKKIGNDQKAIESIRQILKDRGVDTPKTGKFLEGKEIAYVKRGLADEVRDIAAKLQEGNELDAAEQKSVDAKMLNAVKPGSHKVK